MTRALKHLFVCTLVDHRDQAGVMGAQIMNAELCAMQTVLATSSESAYQTLYGLGQMLGQGMTLTKHDCLRDGDMEACVDLAEANDSLVLVLLTHPEFASELATKCAEALFGRSLSLPPVEKGGAWYVTHDNVPVNLTF